MCGRASTRLAGPATFIAVFALRIAITGMHTVTRQYTSRPMRGFTLGQGSNCPKHPSLARKCVAMVTGAVCSIKTCKQLCRGGRFLKVGVIVVHLALWPVF